MHNTNWRLRTEENGAALMPPKTNIIVYVKRREKKAHTEKWPNSGNKNLDKNDPNGKTTVEIVVFSSIMQIKILCNFILRCDR